MSPSPSLSSTSICCFLWAGCGVGWWWWDTGVDHDAVIGTMWAGFWQGGLGSMKGVPRKSGATTAARADATLLNRFVVPSEPAPTKTGNDWTGCVVFLGYGIPLTHPARSLALPYHSCDNGGAS